MRGSAILSTALLAALLAAGSVPASFAQDAPGSDRVPNPFGPGHDPLKDAPVEASEKGPGIVEASFVAAGKAVIEQEKVDGADEMLAVLLDVRVAPASTTPRLTASTITLQGRDDDEKLPLKYLCLPTAEAPLTVAMNAGVKIRTWNVAVGDRTFFCGGPPARRAADIGDYGLRLSTAEAEWKGPLLLFFEKAPQLPVAVELGRTTVKIAVPDEQKN